jgi:sterol desaturase/sphingolipid hydroxylase (fatty acid hydroxylase superfamily)
MVYIQFYQSLKPKKFNPNNQYDKNHNAGFFYSSNGLLQKEIFLTTLGWLQSTAFQVYFFQKWASGKLEYEENFWDRPYFNLFTVLIVSYWREFHFYWCHRVMHPWWKKSRGLSRYDFGAFLYKHFHSVHHKSYNPGPWSGLSMHPVEHFFYYTCAILPLWFKMHPLHFLYTIYHANISPVGGHDGFGYPGGNSTYHYLHHALFECNYGTPLVDFDTLFGTKIDYNDYMKNKAKYEEDVKPK